MTLRSLRRYLIFRALGSWRPPPGIRHFGVYRDSRTGRAEVQLFGCCVARARYIPDHARVRDLHPTLDDLAAELLRQAAADHERLPAGDPHLGRVAR